ncbi:hypothetical protein [Acidaminococcus massiliensis]|jgi:hypothetical protein|uniref:hypothetical protein n=1 Tax=Acidaminococcus massiliensis TaxID=1852375 RepID=UPI002049B277|nr:hypothetical protein [Acidaminococcus massiliensis]DAR24903.1 MAG TPA: hypothetical protein [Caudoviricetes sp.]
MLTELNLMDDFGMVLAKYLNENQKIKEYCNKQFGKELTIYVGELLRDTIPTSENCPYIVITELSKREGTREEVNHKVEYTCMMYIGISAPRKKLNTVDNNILTYDGCQTLGTLMNLVQTELMIRHDGERPFNQVEATIVGPIEPDGSHWGGTLNCRWKMAQTLGLSAMEKF